MVKSALWVCERELRMATLSRESALWREEKRVKHKCSEEGDGLSCPNFAPQPSQCVGLQVTRVDPSFERTHIVYPRDVSRYPGEDCRLLGDITSLAGNKAGHSMDSILAIHRAVEGASRITLQRGKPDS